MRPATRPRKLGDYELLELLGEGGEGEVWRARYGGPPTDNLATGDLVALKRLKSVHGGLEASAFAAQIAVLPRLRHPTIARFRGSCLVPGYNALGDDAYCLVTELLEGETLKQRLQKSSAGLAWGAAREILGQVLDGLEYLHGLGDGLVHRDLKSSNIFLTAEGGVKLLDFGLGVRPVHEGDETAPVGQVKGSFEYLAPEFSLDGTLFDGDVRSDLYSFGVCAFEVLTGRLPFESLKGAGAQGFFHFWSQPTPPRISWNHGAFRVVPQAKQWLERCLHPEARGRFASIREAREALEGIQPRRMTCESRVYEFSRFLGQGGYGEVYEATAPAAGERVAIKLLFEQLDQRRFLREARLLHALRHERLVRYVGFTSPEEAASAGRLAIVLEYLPGMPEASLRQRIGSATRGLPVEEMVELFAGYLDCLHYLHGQGVFHRDIKPANLYAPAGAPERGKVFDLGVARDENGSKTTGFVPGTLNYMPPEFARSENFRGSPASDIFSLTVSLYEAVTGRLPFPGFSRHESEALREFSSRASTGERAFEGMIAYADPAFEQCPKLAEVIRRGLCYRPSARYSTAHAMAEELRGLLPEDRRPTWGEDETPTRTAEPKDVGRPHRRFIFAGLLIAGLAVAVFLRDVAMKSWSSNERATSAPPRLTTLSPRWWHEGLAAFLPPDQQGQVSARVPSDSIGRGVAASLQQWWASDDWIPPVRPLPNHEQWRDGLLAKPVEPAAWDEGLMGLLEQERKRRREISNRLDWLRTRWEEPASAWASSNAWASWQRLWPDGLGTLRERELAVTLTNALAGGPPRGAGEWLDTLSNVVATTRLRLASITPLPEVVAGETLGQLSNRVAESGWRGWEQWREAQSKAWTEVKESWHALTNRSDAWLSPAGRYPRLLVRVDALRAELRSTAEVLRTERDRGDAMIGQRHLDTLQQHLEELRREAEQSARRVDEVRATVLREIASLGSADPVQFMPVLSEARRQIETSECVADLADAVGWVDRAEIALKQLGNFEEQLAMSAIAAAERWPTNQLGFLHVSRLLAGRAEAWMREVSDVLAAGKVAKAEELLPAVDIVGRYPSLVKWHRERVREAKVRLREPQPKDKVLPELRPGRKFAAYWLSSDGLLPQTDPTVAALRRELDRIADGETRHLPTSEYEVVEPLIQRPAEPRYSSNPEDPNLESFEDYPLEKPCPAGSALLREEFGYYLRIKVEKQLIPAAKIRLNITMVRFGGKQGTNFELSEDFEPELPNAGGRRPSAPTSSNNRSRPERPSTVGRAAPAAHDEGNALRKLAEKLWDQVRRHRERLASDAGQ